MLCETEIVDCNEQFARMLSMDKASIIGRSIAELSVPIQEDGSHSEAKAAQVFESVVAGRPGWIDWRMKRANGQLIDIEASLSRATLDGESILVATTRDVTARKLIERERQLLLDELSDKEEMIRLAGMASGVVSGVFDLGTGAVSWSDGAEDSLGVERGTLGKSMDEFKANMNADELIEFERALADGLRSGEVFKLEISRLEDDADNVVNRWFSVQGKANYNERHEAVTIRGTIADITEQKNTRQEIETLAYYDPLTGLANRRLLLDRLQQCCSQAERRGSSGALLFIDLDHFKLLNDSLGHQVGDELLIEVGHRLQACLRTEDTVARMGGDEFVVLLPSISGDPGLVASRVHTVAGKVGRSIAKDYIFNDNHYQMSGSIGVAIFPEDGTKANIILQHADAAMYLAKKSGRDTVAFYHASLQTEADSRLSLEAGLRNATDRGELELYYQPQVDVAHGGQVVGAEALLRWNHPENGLVMPDTFIPVAEETGLILSVGKWVLGRACVQCALWNEGRDEKNRIGIAVNVSPVQFRHQNFVGEVKSIISEQGLDPELVTLEITEGTLIDNLEDTKIKLDELQKFGVRISIDDFGTGYSSLYYLKNLPLDELKIDRIFIRDIIDDLSDAAIVSSILAIAENLELSVVAEGVETDEQAKFLINIGCNINQGYLYAKPLPAQVFTAKYLQLTDAGVDVL
ncbi:MAG: EAL domain-containing protein [Porticoccaceae bacterium]|nr:EAL domain-containing protein [Porticoccaceae bacterium]